MFQTRLATLDDLTQLLKFEQAIIAAERPFDASLKPGKIHYYDLAEMIRSPQSDVYVIDIDGRLVASGFVKTVSSKSHYTHTQHAYLGFMYVVPEYRGQGLNKQIMDGILAWCKDRQIDELRLDVYAQNAGAISAYEKSGFRSNLVEMRLNLKDKGVQ